MQKNSRNKAITDETKVSGECLVNKIENKKQFFLLFLEGLGFIIEKAQP